MGKILIAKVPMRPAVFSQGCVAGFDRALVESGIQRGELTLALRGTSIASKSIIHGCGAEGGLATQGFRDMPEFAYQTHPDAYDLNVAEPRSLISRHRCFGIPCRTWPDGSIRIPLDDECVRNASGTLPRPAMRGTGADRAGADDQAIVRF